MKMGFNMQKLMKQAQKMQQDMAKVQEELQNTEVEGSSGGGMVRVVANGSGEILSLSINPEIIDPEDHEMLEDLVLAAVKDALTAAAALSAEKMGRVTGGVNMPGMF
ncbi:MAG: YbaB/EbfC family nucleoid-associated protein [Clostridia bacterium]|nr:YbaB/EbfC family nucleoid-associated protein [Clostridia bacterium]